MFWWKFTKKVPWSSTTWSAWMIPADGPLGTPIREEEWYQIGQNLFSLKVVVFPGELVPVSSKAMKWLLTERIYGNDPDGDYILLQYQEFSEMMTDLGFARI